MNNLNSRTIVRIAALAVALLGLAACGGTPSTSTKAAAQVQADAQANARATLAYVDPRASYKSEAIKPAGVP
jgi:hypothetical protein